MDKELGYSFRATTFYHEYGYYLAHELFEKITGKREGRDENGWLISDFNALQKADDFIAAQKEAYQRALKEYNEALVKWETYADQVPAAQATNERAGLLSDFIAGATGGRISPCESGCWGHPKSYWQGRRTYGTKLPGQRNGVETWAEYVSFKMTKDKKGLAMFKEYLLKTFAEYEEIYPKMGGLLNGQE